MILEFLSRVDLAILHFFNVELLFWHSDQIWAAISHMEKQKWFVLGFLPLLLLFLFVRFGLYALKILGSVGVAVALSDLISYRVIKHFVSRPRPIDNPELASWLRHIGEAHGPSFPSNHASNCFAGAVILTFFFPELSLLFYFLAILVAVSRVALGVHYPSDVLAGAALGIFVGFFTKIFILRGNSFLPSGLGGTKPAEDSRGWRTRNNRLG